MQFINPGDTKDFHVWTDMTDHIYSSSDGLCTLEIWAGIPPTKVQAKWEEEVLGGPRWVSRGVENVTGINERFSRTVFLAPTENLRLDVSGVTATPGERRRCYYTVRCSDECAAVTCINSHNIRDPGTWFVADDHLSWYWSGCTTWVVVNRLNNTILLLDAYVSKASAGNRHDFGYNSSEKVRVVRFVNTLRHFVDEGYDIAGVLTSHKHGDHIGDLPYILGGLSAAGSDSFLGSGVALTGSPFSEDIPVVMSADTVADPYFAGRHQDPNYVMPHKIIIPQFNGREVIDRQDFTRGDAISLNGFEIIPYVWYHGRIGDDIHDDLRVLAYTVKRVGESPDIATTFVTTGFCQRREQAAKIVGKIDCHHLIFAWQAGPFKAITAGTAGVVNLIPRPDGDNFIFANHSDMNSMRYDNARSDAMDMFGWLVQAEVVSIRNGDSYWCGQKRPLRLGYFRNRLGVDDSTEKKSES